MHPSRICPDILHSANHCRPDRNIVWLNTGLRTHFPGHRDRIIAWGGGLRVCGLLFRPFISKKRLKRETAIDQELLVGSLDVAARRLAGSTLDNAEADRVLANVVYTFVVGPPFNEPRSGAETFGFRNPTEFAEYIISGLNDYATSSSKDRIQTCIRRFGAALMGFTAESIVGTTRMFIDGPFQTANLCLVELLEEPTFSEEHFPNEYLSSVQDVMRLYRRVDINLPQQGI